MTTHAIRWPRPIGIALAVTGLFALFALAACGPSSTKTTPKMTPTMSPTITAQPTKAENGESFALATGSMGKHLTADGGRAVYLWQGDKGAKSSCAGACAKVWPPVTTNGAIKRGAGLDAEDFATVKRADGSLQVTYYGHPLYYFGGDSAPGDTKGQGSDGFGAKWWLVAPSGDGISGSKSTSGSSSSNGSGY